MFENIIEQSAAVQLRNDILQNRLAPSMLFFGPKESGKCSTAIELARSLSCTEVASWKCTCSSCESYRYLQSSDLLMLGQRNFIAEISASAASFLRNLNVSSVKILFIRSLRKLQMRFSPVITEGDSKLSSLISVLQSLEEKANELWMTDFSDENKAAAEKLTGSILKDAASLAKGVSLNIPVEHIRRAAYWCHLAPLGKRKTLVIENADNMRDDARNTLLKILEEPPAKVNIILAAQRRETIIATILSRVRPYRFLRRSLEGEKDVLRRVYQVPQHEIDNFSVSSGTSLISAYLDSFIAHNSGKMRSLAAFFIVAAAFISQDSLKKANKNIPSFITSLIERYSKEVMSCGFNLSVLSSDAIKNILEKSGNFEDDSFPEFLKSCLDIVSEISKTESNPQFIACNNIIKKHIQDAASASVSLNINKVLVLESLLYNIHSNITELV